MWVIEVLVDGVWEPMAKAAFLDFEIAQQIAKHWKSARLESLYQLRKYQPTDWTIEVQ